VGCRAGLDVFEKEKNLLPLPGFELWTVQSRVKSLYDYITQADLYNYTVTFQEIRSV
jgi:hypothetical protein